MKRYLIILAIFLGIILVGCGSQSQQTVKKEPRLNGEPEKQASQRDFEELAERHQQIIDSEQWVRNYFKDKDQVVIPNLKITHRVLFTVTDDEGYADRDFQREFTTESLNPDGYKANLNYNNGLHLNILFPQARKFRSKKIASDKNVATKFSSEDNYYTNTVTSYGDSIERPTILGFPPLNEETFELVHDYVLPPLFEIGPYNNCRYFAEFPQDSWMIEFREVVAHTCWKRRPEYKKDELKGVEETYEGFKENYERHKKAILELIENDPLVKQNFEKFKDQLFDEKSLEVTPEMVSKLTIITEIKGHQKQEVNKDKKEDKAKEKQPQKTKKQTKIDSYDKR